MDRTARQLKSSFHELLLTIMMIIFLLPSCGRHTQSVKEKKAVLFDKMVKNKIHRVCLSEEAMNEFQIHTEPLTITHSTKPRKMIHISSIIYDAQGRAWVYTRLNSLTFIRAPIQIASIHNDDVFLRCGPGVGTDIVTDGVSELYGIEYLKNIDE